MSARRNDIPPCAISANRALALVGFLLCSLLPANALAADTTAVPDRALLALDKVMSGTLVAGRNITVTYTIHNVGARTATSVQLKDASFPASRFNTDLPARKTWEQLDAGASVSHSVQVEPKRAGELFVAPAAVSYLDEGEKRVSRIADADSFVVEDLLAFRRRTDSHASTWMIYAGCLFLLGVAPFGASAMIVRGLPSDTAPKKS